MTPRKVSTRKETTEFRKSRILVHERRWKRCAHAGNAGNVPEHVKPPKKHRAIHSPESPWSDVTNTFIGKKWEISRWHRVLWCPICAVTIFCFEEVPFVSFCFFVLRVNSTKQNKLSFLQLCGQKTCRMFAHHGRLGPHLKKCSCSITQFFSRPKVSRGLCVISEEPCVRTPSTLKKWTKAKQQDFTHKVSHSFQSLREARRPGAHIFTQPVSVGPSETSYHVSVFVFFSHGADFYWAQPAGFEWKWTHFQHLFPVQRIDLKLHRFAKANSFRETKVSCSWDVHETWALCTIL